MEVIYAGEKSLRLKSKTALLGLYAQDEKEKNSLDALLSFEGHTISSSPVVLAGPGEYEVKGVKLTGVGKESLKGFSGKIENMYVFIGRASEMNDTKDVPESDIAIIRADAAIDLKPLAHVGARLVMLSGPEALKIAQQLQPDTQPVNKCVITKDKLTDDMQVVVLG